MRLNIIIYAKLKHNQFHTLFPGIFGWTLGRFAGVLPYALAQEGWSSLATFMAPALQLNGAVF